MRELLFRVALCLVCGLATFALCELGLRRRRPRGTNAPAGRTRHDKKRAA
jgi:hypothetical protein